MFYAFAVPAEEVDLSLPHALRDFPPGLDREVAYLQQFSGGDIVVVAQVGEAAGKVSTIGVSRIPASTIAFQAVPGNLAADDLYVSALPLLPGKLPQFTVFAAELDGPRNQDLLAQMETAHHGEIVFIQPGQSDYVIPIVIGSRPWEDEHRAAPGESEFNLWVNEQLMDMHGISFGDAPPPANRLLWDVRRDGKKA